MLLREEKRLWYKFKNISPIFLVLIQCVFEHKRCDLLQCSLRLLWVVQVEGFFLWAVPVKPSLSRGLLNWYLIISATLSRESYANESINIKSTSMNYHCIDNISHCLQPAWRVMYWGFWARVLVSPSPGDLHRQTDSPGGKYGHHTLQTHR